MKTTLESFTTKDKLELPGLLYTPKKKTKKVLLYLHGNGDSSILYKVTHNKALAHALEKENIAYFPFNNRGAQFFRRFTVSVNKKKKHVHCGSAYELIKDCVIDIDAALSFLRKKGFTEYYVMGHSTGANKICVYNYYKPQNKIKKYILSAGGDDTGHYYDLLKKKGFMKFVKKARTYAQSRKRLELVTDLFYPAISWQSLYDTINPDGDYNIFPYNEYFNNLKLAKKNLFREFSSIHKSTLVVYGSEDEYLPRPIEEVMELLNKKASNPDLFNFEIIKGADHSYHGQEKELAERLARWLST